MTNGLLVVAPMYWSIGMEMESGSRMATARTARHISIAKLALAVARIGRAAWARFVMFVSAATKGRIPCMTVE
jgi:hypothetical protein